MILIQQAAKTVKSSRNAARKLSQQEKNQPRSLIQLETKNWVISPWRFCLASNSIIWKNDRNEIKYWKWYCLTILGNHSHGQPDRSGIADDPNRNAKTKKLQLINHGSRNQSNLDTNTTIKAYNNHNESNRRGQKSNWQSLCEKSVAIAKILNSFSMKLSNILVTTLDKIFRHTKKMSNQSHKLATPTKSYERQ